VTIYDPKTGGRGRTYPLSLPVEPIKWLQASPLDQGTMANVEPRLDELTERGEPVPLTYPGDLPELLRWEEPFRAITLTPDGTTRVWELWRVEVGANVAFVLERLSTYLRVSSPAGVFFLTGPNTDPLAPVVGPGGEILQVAWTLDVAGNDNESSRFLFGDTLTLLPAGRPAPGLPRTWRDFRYSHGNRYSEGKQLVLPGPVVVRFFVQVASVGALPPETVNAGSLMSGYQVAAGTRSMAAIRASVFRS